MNFEPFHTHSDNHKHVFYINDSKDIIVKQYVESDAAESIQREREKLELWRANGFDTPKLCTASTALLDPSRCVAMEYLHVISLKQILAESDREWNEIEAYVRLLFASIAERHRFALKTGDKRFIHPDPHPGNVLFEGERLVYVDFGHHPQKYDVLKCAVWELSRWARNLLKQTDIKHMQIVADMVVEAYGDCSEVLNALIKQDYKSPRIQKFKDRLRGRSYAWIRRYEFAAALKRSLESPDTA